MKHKDDDKKETDGLGIVMSAYDWREAMRYATFRIEDIKEVILIREGYNDGDHWLLVVLLKTGEYGWLDAWCDYSGWDCESDGDSGICSTKEEALKRIGKGE